MNPKSHNISQDRNSQDRNEEPEIQVAIAILSRQSKFLLQLRDNIPNIIHPGCWALFGGHLEPGEDSEQGLKRELLEEIGYAPPVVNLFGTYPRPGVIRYVYHAELSVDIDDLKLGEGWDMAWVSVEDIQTGECYSAIAKQVRPIAFPHQQILLEFVHMGIGYFRSSVLG
ncbi:NUDIX hydrolase [Pseudanabaena sp. PCC 6802]|uniref:NUDIX hydrolase n=1 Tax=Pseudanabaena sp. PCC 6802 TaxID=118173 RepID=UPI0003495F9C|nr:NUDIX hydrolase [Pseudanabaena sp. PCC 6802]